MGMYSLKLFAGVGFLVDTLLGHVPVGAVEIDPWCQAIIAEHQRCRRLAPFPVWDDITTFSRYHGECREYFSWLRSIRDELVIDGGFPCQDISLAGDGAGMDGARSGLWSHQARLIGEVRPAYAFVENVAALAHRGLDRVLGDLAALGYDARWGVVTSAEAEDGRHLRERLWILAHRHGHGFAGLAGLAESDERPEQSGQQASRRGDAVGCGELVAHAHEFRLGGRSSADGDAAERIEGIDEPRGLRDVADADGGGRGQGRHHLRARESDAAGYGALADSDSDSGERRGRRGHLGRSPADGAGEADERQRHGRTALDRGTTIGGGQASHAQPGLGRAGDHALAGWLDWPAARGCRGGRPGEPQEEWEPTRTCATYPGRSHRLRIIGNGWDPYAAAWAWRRLGGP